MSIMQRIRIKQWAAAWFLVTMALGAQAALTFEPVSTENGIVVSRAWVEAKGIYRVRVETTATESVDALIKMNTDTPAWPTWMPKVTQAKYLEPGDQHYIVYMQYASPWPVADRESVTESQIVKLPGSEVVELRFHSIESDYPVAEGRLRIPHIQGYWRYTPVDEKKTVIRYEVELDPGGTVPKWMVNLESVEIPKQTIVKCLENIGPYMSARLDWLH